MQVCSRPYSIAPVNENLNATILQNTPPSAQFSANPTRVMMMIIIIIKKKNENVLLLHITWDYAGKRTRVCFNMVFFCLVFGVCVFFLMSRRRTHRTSSVGRQRAEYYITARRQDGYKVMILHIHAHTGLHTWT